MLERGNSRIVAHQQEKWVTRAIFGYHQFPLISFILNTAPCCPPVMRESVSAACLMAKASREIPRGEIGSIFGVKKGTVHRVRSDTIGDIERDTRRTTILPPDEEAHVMADIIDRFQRGASLFPKQLRAETLETFHKQVCSSGTWDLVKRHQGVLERATAHPQEESRMNISKEIARLHIRHLELDLKDR
jgi:hypothetical protein